VLLSFFFFPSPFLPTTTDSRGGGGGARGGDNALLPAPHVSVRCKGCSVRHHRSPVMWMRTMCLGLRCRRSTWRCVAPMARLSGSSPEDAAMLVPLLQNACPFVKNILFDDDPLFPAAAPAIIRRRMPQCRRPCQPEMTPRQPRRRSRRSLSTS
jgi:hypothetical protein